MLTLPPSLFDFDALDASDFAGGVAQCVAVAVPVAAVGPVAARVPKIAARVPALAPTTAEGPAPSPLPAALTALLGALNPAQRAATLSRASRVRILAGAGSGKTRVLTARVAHLIAAQGVEPSAIVLTTFTRKAAREMEQRIATLLPAEAARGLTVGTFHSLGVQLLRANAASLGLPPSMTVADEAATAGRAGRVLVQQGETPTSRSVTALLEEIGIERVLRLERMWATYMAGQPLVADPMAMFLGTDLAEASPYRRYHALCQAEGAVDFDALGILPVLLFLTRPDLRDVYRTLWRYLLIDEFQDTSVVQMMLVRLLVGPETSICIVGDDAQAIYGFRGADVSHIQTFDTLFPETVSFRLEENYRSQPKIVEAANELVTHTGTLPKTLHTAQSEARPIVVLDCATPTSEAIALVDRLQCLREAGEIRTWNEVMVLYRTHGLADALEAACIARRIPVRVSRGLRFFSRAEPRALLAPLLLAVNGADGDAFRRVADLMTPRPSDTAVRQVLAYAAEHTEPALTVAKLHRDRAGVSKPQAKALDGLLTFIDGVRAAGRKSPEAALRYVLAETQMQVRLQAAVPSDDATLDDRVPPEEIQRRVDVAEQRVRNIDDVVLMAASFAVDALAAGRPATLTAFLDDLAVLLDPEEPGPACGAIQAMSVHSAKGLEAPVVAVIGCNEGVFPSFASMHTEGPTSGLDLEEARLFYVAITRAERHLILTSARARPRRARQATLQASAPSRFLAWLPDWCHVVRRLT